MNIRDMIHELGVLLLDEDGLMNSTIGKDFHEEYKDFDTVTSWECFVSEVNRVDAVVELYDFLAGLSEESLDKLDLLLGDVE